MKRHTSCAASRRLPPLSQGWPPDPPSQWAASTASRLPATAVVKRSPSAGIRESTGPSSAQAPGMVGTLRNTSASRVLGGVSVNEANGVSSETNALNHAACVLGPWQSDLVSGWRKSSSEIAVFHFIAEPAPDVNRTGHLVKNRCDRRGAIPRKAATGAGVFVQPAQPREGP